MKLTIKDISYISIFSALTAIGAFVSLPLGQVPITMQSLFVLLSGLILGPRLAFMSQVVYMLLGLIGLPIFSGFTGGPQALLRPSFGFVIGFIVASFIVGKIGYINKKKKKKKIWLASFIGSFLIYIFGLPYMYIIVNNVMHLGLSPMQVFKMGCLLFLPGDLLKLGLASVIAIRMKNTRNP